MSLNKMFFNVFRKLFHKKNQILSKTYENNEKKKNMDEKKNVFYNSNIPDS